MTLYIDNSTLSAMAKCSTYALMRYSLGWTSKEESVRLKCGMVVHTALERWLKGESEPLAVLTTEYQDWWLGNGWEDPAYSPENVYDLVSYYMETHPIEKLPYRVNPELVEVGFAVPLDEHGDLMLTGRFDVPVQDRDSGAWYVLDHKTTGRLTARFVQHFHMDSQMSGYIYALSQEVKEPVVGALINVIEITKLPEVRYTKGGGEYKCRTHGGPISQCRLSHAKQQQFVAQRTLQQLEQWRATALDLAEEYQKQYDLMRWQNESDVAWEGKMASLPMEGQFNRSCDWCEFNDWCAMGRQERHIDLMFKYEPWEPFKILKEEAV